MVASPEAMRVVSTNPGPARVRLAGFCKRTIIEASKCGRCETRPTAASCSRGGIRTTTAPSLCQNSHTRRTWLAAGHGVAAHERPGRTEHPRGLGRHAGLGGAYVGDGRPAAQPGGNGR